MKDTKNKIYKSTLTIFWSTLFIMVMGVMYSCLEDYMGLLTNAFIAIFVSFLAIMTILGLAQIILVAKAKATFTKIAKVFFILTGASGFGIGFSLAMHGLVYFVAIKLFGEGIWNNVPGNDEPVFFILATIVCPLALLVGAIGSIVLIAMKKVRI